MRRAIRWFSLAMYVICYLSWEGSEWVSDFYYRQMNFWAKVHKDSIGEYDDFNK